MTLGNRIASEARYWNNGFGICIAASITEGVDWAAYIGADDGYSEESCKDNTLLNGAKLSKEDAKYFFPNIDLPYRN